MPALDQLGRWPVGRLAAGVVGPGGTISTAGPTGRPFAWASLTKMLTALATLVAVEETTVTLDEPAGPPGSTLRHLLAHASGLAVAGESVLAPPGTRRIYSNAGFDVVAEVVAERARMPFGDYVAAGVLGPLGMTATTWGASGATGVTGPLDDLLALAGELATPTLIAPATLAEATRPAFGGIAGVLPGFGRHDPNDWGLGFELRGAKAPHWTGASSSPRTFGHFGRAGGFLWVDPDVDLACGCLTDRDFGPWAAEAWPALTDAILAEHSFRDLAAPES
ncbi:MAG: serine hydrolase domain-containing protein [Acidimicrobiales bacterium]